MEYEALEEPNNKWTIFEKRVDTCISVALCLTFAGFIAYLLVRVDT